MGGGCPLIWHGVAGSDEVTCSVGGAFAGRIIAGLSEQTTQCTHIETLSTGAAQV